MKKIKLGLSRPFRNSVDISIIDVSTGDERKRGVMTAEYSEWDIKPLKDKGLDLEGIVADYEEWVHKTLRRHLLVECQVVEGMDEFKTIVRDRVKDFF